VGDNVLHHIVPVLALGQFDTYSEQFVEHLFLAAPDRQKFPLFFLLLLALLERLELVLPVENVFMEFLEVFLDDSAAVGMKR